MRIISGKYKGRRLRPVFSSKSKTVRPTSDFVKNAFFNMIQFELEDSEVCDLFAGSGALGLEAISRGAKHCTFVEKNPRIFSGIRNSLNYLEVPHESYKLVKMSVERFVPWNESKFDFIFMDPPYNKDLVNPVLLKIIESRSLKPGGKILIEHSASEKIIPQLRESLRVVNEKNYGETTVTILMFEEEEI